MAEEITETISLSRTTIVNATREDKEISASYNRLVRAAIKRAEWTLQYGSPDQKMQIIKSAMMSASRLAALDTRSEVEEQRIAFEQLVDEMTDIPEIKHIVTKDHIVDVVSKAIPQSVDDQDDRERFQETGS